MPRRAPGSGTLYRPRYRRPDGNRRRSSIWWIAYLDASGQRVHESTGKRVKADADRVLRERLAKIDRGRPAGPGVDDTTMADLAALIRDDYAAHGRRSADRLERSLSHLLAGLGEDTPARIVDEGRVTAYIAARRADGAAVASVNRELAALRRAFRLAMRAGRVERRPDVQALTERNARHGFFEGAQLQAVLARLPADLQAPVLVAYATGWRMHSEILTRQWRHVDLEAGWLRLEPGEGKTGEGRQFPLAGELLELLRRQREATDALERAGQIIPWVFHRSGRRIRDLRGAWHTACKEAGVPGRIIHDLRRTAVRNLERAGVSRSVAMKLVGHRTESIYRRYAIASEADLREAGERLHFNFTSTSHSAHRRSGARRRARKSL